MFVGHLPNLNQSTYVENLSKRIFNVKVVTNYVYTHIYGIIVISLKIILKF